MHSPITRNILYTPLFIACLNLIAVLYGLDHLKLQESKPVYRVHRFNLPNDRRERNIFSAWEVLQEFKRRKQVVYVLRGNEEDNNKIDIIRLHALQIKYSCDTNTLITIHLRDNTTYGEFIRLLDMMLTGKHKRYMLYQNEFYIVPPKPYDCIEEEFSQHDLPVKMIFL